MSKGLDFELDHFSVAYEHSQVQSSKEMYSYMSAGSFAGKANPFHQGAGSSKTP